jgi:hypothetical protein
MEWQKARMVIVMLFLSASVHALPLKGATVLNGHGSLLT